MDKKKQNKVKTTLSRAQEISYLRDFKTADRAGGFMKKDR
ncbi:MAG: YfhE family protein [Bacillales bacterium]|nr:YfhE family protein [Bacillales bacterium]